MRCCVVGMVLLLACSSDPGVAPVVAPIPPVTVAHASPPRPVLPAPVADGENDDDPGDVYDVTDDADDDRPRGEPPGFVEHVVIDLSHDVDAEIVVLPDRDDDGIPDRFDGCPTEPEDEDGWEDDDGCPDADHDREEIIDVEDRCPDSPEDYDGWDDDGCPEPASAVL